MQRKNKTREASLARSLWQKFDKIRAKLINVSEFQGIRVIRYCTSYGFL